MKKLIYLLPMIFLIFSCSEDTDDQIVKSQEELLAKIVDGDYSFNDLFEKAPLLIDKLNSYVEMPSTMNYILHSDGTIKMLYTYNSKNIDADGMITMNNSFRLYTDNNSYKIVPQIDFAKSGETRSMGYCNGRLVLAGESCFYNCSRGQNSSGDTPLDDPDDENCQSTFFIVQSTMILPAVIDDGGSSGGGGGDGTSSPSLLPCYQDFYNQLTKEQRRFWNTNLKQSGIFYTSIAYCGRLNELRELIETAIEKKHKFTLQPSAVFSSTPAATVQELIEEVCITFATDSMPMSSTIANNVKRTQITIAGTNTASGIPTDYFLTLDLNFNQFGLTTGDDPFRDAVAQSPLEFNSYNYQSIGFSQNMYLYSSIYKRFKLVSNLPVSNGNLEVFWEVPVNISLIPSNGQVTQAAIF